MGIIVFLFQKHLTDYRKNGQMFYTHTHTHTHTHICFYSNRLDVFRKEIQYSPLQSSSLSPPTVGVETIPTLSLSLYIYIYIYVYIEYIRLVSTLEQPKWSKRSIYNSLEQFCGLAVQCCVFIFFFFF